MAEVTITAAEAADRLGVKVTTIYAYVSRGMLTRRRSPSGQSLFDQEEIDHMAHQGRPQGRPRSVAAHGTDDRNEIVISSRITELRGDRSYYRGRDSIELARTWSFEAVSEWLWNGARSESADWGAPESAAVDAGRAAQDALPERMLPLERLQAIVPALGAVDPLRGNLTRAAVTSIGRTLISGMVASLPGPTVSGTVADRLWAKLGGTQSQSLLPDVLRAAMVLLADHELAASTLTVRIAASVRADPYAAVMAGLGTMSGPLHGGASLGVESLLLEVSSLANAWASIGLRLRQSDRVPGFGHTVYHSTDSRSTELLELVRKCAPSHPAVIAADAILAEARHLQLPEPNVDFPLAVLTRVADMPLGAGEAIFAVARTAGWLAHALEEYENRTQLRLRIAHVPPGA